MLNKNIEKIFNEEALKLINSKNDDYANPTDFYANFRLSEQAGVPMFIGIHIRLLDKISRLNSFIERYNRTGEITAHHESIEDTLLDTINYAAIMLDTYRKFKGASYASDTAIDITKAGQNTGNTRYKYSWSPKEENGKNKGKA